MKDVLTVITFVVGVVCFLMFLNVFKLDARGVLLTSSRCEMAPSGAPECRNGTERSER